MITIRSSHERNCLRIIVDAALPQKTVVVGTDVNKTVVGNGKNKELYTQDVGPGSWEVTCFHKSGNRWKKSKMRYNPSFFGGEAALAEDSSDNDYNDVIVAVLPYS